MFKKTVPFLLVAIFILAAGAAFFATRHHDRTWVIYRPSDSTFYVKHDGANNKIVQIAMGQKGDIPLWADFTGTGKGEPAVYRKGQWLISTHADGTPDLTINFGGQPDDIPLVADIDGDGKPDLVIFRDGVWYVRGTLHPSDIETYSFGTKGDIPMLADFNHDGVVDLAVFRKGHWYVDTKRDGHADMDFVFGDVNDKYPLAADWRGDGRIVPVLFRDGSWLVGDAHGGKVDATVAFGTRGDVPLAISAEK